MWDKFFNQDVTSTTDEQKRNVEMLFRDVLPKLYALVPGDDARSEGRRVAMARAWALRASP